MLLVLFPSTFLSPSTSPFIYVFILFSLHTFLAGLDALITVLSLPFNAIYWSILFWTALVYGAVVAVPMFAQDILECVRGVFIELAFRLLMELHDVRHLDDTIVAGSTSNYPTPYKDQSRIEEVRSNTAIGTNQTSFSLDRVTASTVNSKSAHTNYSTLRSTRSAVSKRRGPSSSPSLLSSHSNPKPKPKPGLSLLLTRKLGSLIRFTAASPLPKRSNSKSRSRKIRSRRKTTPGFGSVGGEVEVGRDGGHVAAHNGRGGQVRSEARTRTRTVNDNAVTDDIKCEDECPVPERQGAIVPVTKVLRTSKYSQSKMNEKGNPKRREERYRDLAEKLKRLKRLMDDR